MIEKDRNNAPDQSKLQALLKRYDLDDTDAAMLRHVMSEPAISAKELGKLVGLSDKQIERRRRREGFKTALRKLLIEPVEIIQNAVRQVARRYVQIANSPDDRIAERACAKILLTYGVLRSRVTIDTPVTEAQRFEAIMGLVARAEQKKAKELAEDAEAGEENSETLRPH